MYPTLNGKTSIQKSLDDSDHPQTHIISPGTFDKGKLVGWGIILLPADTLVHRGYMIGFSLIRFDSTKNLCTAYRLISFEAEMYLV